MKLFRKNKIKCNVCGNHIKPEREKTIQTNTGVANCLNSPICFDVMDCPECGCQITLQVREVIVCKRADTGED